jgi:drug/metabolite transporter (DMT)-like permease
LGDRSLISGNLLEWSAIVKLLFNWKFILAMTLAVFARISYVFLNNSFLKVPRLASISTTLTTFVTLISLLFIVLANYYFLDEKLNMQQMAGAAIILLGVGIMMK